MAAVNWLVLLGKSFGVKIMNGELQLDEEANNNCYFCVAMQIGESLTNIEESVR